MRIEWTAAAIRDRDEIFDQIAADDPSAAERIDLRFETTAARLADFPYLARLGSLPGTRELIPHESYRIVYKSTANWF